MRPIPFASLALLAALAAGGPGCGGDPAPASAGAPGERGAAPLADGVLRILTLNRLQGFAEGIPCLLDDPAPLAAAARLRDEHRREGRDALLVVLGDTLRPTGSLDGFPPADVSHEGRSGALLDALAAAKVDVWVPGHVDLYDAIPERLDRARELGLTVLLSNVELPGRDDVLKSLVVEAGTLRIGLLAFLPLRHSAGPGDAAELVRHAGASMRPVVQTASRLARELIEEGGAHLVVALSSLNQEGNLRLAEIEDIHVVLGSSEENLPAGMSLVSGGAVQLSALPAGQQAGETVLAVRDGVFTLPDISAIHTLPAILAAEQADIDRLEQVFGTSDAQELARLASPGHEELVLNKVRRVTEGREFLARHGDGTGSYLAHHAVALAPVPEDDPVLAALARQGEAIERAFAASKLPPPVAPTGKLLIPLPESCGECHVEQHRFWLRTDHAGSFAALQARERHHDVTCLACHTTAFNDPAGWFDPRFDAPLGPVACYSCHATTAEHVRTRTAVLDPQFAVADAEAMSCESCHDTRRSPGFQREEAVERVRCPPMRADDPVLLHVRQSALAAIERRRERGEAEPRDEYLAARALAGLGRRAEGLALLARLSLATSDDRAMVLGVASLQEHLGGGRDAVATLRGYLAGYTGDPAANEQLLRLLIGSRDPAARDPEQALAMLRVFLANDDGQGLLDFRILEVDALEALGRLDEARALARSLLGKYPREPAVEKRIESLRR